MFNTILKTLFMCSGLAVACNGLAETYTTEHFDVEYDKNVPLTVVEKFADRVAANRKLVLGFLNRSPIYKGTPITERLVVYISKTKRIPYQDWNTIHIPEKRVMAAFADSNIEQSGMAVIHELTHVYAVSSYRKQVKNGHEDRFYDDGLAVYLQHEFGEKPEYPDFGTNLYLAVQRAAKQHGELIPLAQTEDVRHQSKTGAGRKLAYLQEGAFTNFLLENYGLSAYLKLFNGAKPLEVTGKTFAQLEADWQQFIGLFGVEG